MGINLGIVTFIYSVGVVMAEKHVYKNRKWICEACGHKQEGLSWDYTLAPIHCKKPMEPDYGGGTMSAAVIGDSIPGGLVIRHGLCNPDGTPRKYYSKSEINAEAKRRGLMNVVEHVPEPGTDKSKHTTKWV
jgi:hypothetical protein